MQNFQDTFEACKQSFISAFSIRMTVPLLMFSVFKYGRKVCSLLFSMTCKNKHRSTTVLEEILLYLYQHIYSQIRMANPRIYIFSKKVIRTNTENSVEVCLCHIIHSLIQFCLLKFKVVADQFFTLINFIYINMFIKKGQQYYIQRCYRSYVAFLTRMLFVNSGV